MPNILKGITNENLTFKTNSSNYCKDLVDMTKCRLMQTYCVKLFY